MDSCAAEMGPLVADDTDSSRMTTNLPSGINSYPLSFVRNSGFSLSVHGGSATASASRPEFTKKMLQCSCDNPFSAQYRVKKSHTGCEGLCGNLMYGPFVLICLTKRNGLSITAAVLTVLDSDVDCLILREMKGSPLRKTKSKF
jgi:hypothetical protein